MVGAAPTDTAFVRDIVRSGNTFTSWVWSCWYIDGRGAMNDRTADADPQEPDQTFLKSWEISAMYKQNMARSNVP
jgi:hypothetical protein